MVDEAASRKAVEKLLRRQTVVTLDDLFRTLQTESRMTVFRRLRATGYRSSFTHRGSYYTLESIPRFDERGLWFFQGIGFSRAGTLKETVVELVNEADAGYMHPELEGLVHVRVHNTLLEMVRARRIGREKINKPYLYISSDRDRAYEQIAKRREKELAVVTEQVLDLPETIVIEVLLELVRAGGRVVIDPRLVVKRLHARGVPVTDEQVQEVFERHGLGPLKKTAGSRWKSSPG